MDGTLRSGAIRSRNRPICSRWSRAISATSADRFDTMCGRQSRSAHLCRARQREAGALCDGCAQTLDALGRRGLWPRIRSRRLHDRRGIRVQFRRDGEQGPQHLQRQGAAGEPRERNRRRLRPHRSRRRARIFPQLDRRPHHLPRLVPALAQGRPHRLPRDRLCRRHALACGSAHQRREGLAPAPIPGGCGPPRPPRTAAVLHHDRQFLHRDRLREGRGSHRHAAHDRGPGDVPQGHGHLLRAPRRRRGDGRGFRALFRGCERPQARSVPALVFPGRNARSARSRAPTIPPPRPTR